MLGREVLQPLELIYGFPRAENTTYGEYVTQLQNSLTRAHEAARQHLKRSTERYKRNYDLNISKNIYTVGQIVWYLNEQRKKGKCPKLQQVWQGPCVITQKFSDLVYQIQLNKTGKTKIVHHDKLKPHHGENNITWIKHTQKNIQINT